MKVIYVDFIYLDKIVFMRIIGWIVLMMVFIGCKKEIKENHPKIEIYLLKHTVESKEGILFRDTEHYKKDLDSVFQEWYKDERIDTITGEFIYGGSFQAAASDLQDYPFIKDNEILGFDSKQDFLVFDSVVRRRVSYLFPGKKNVQFALAIDRKPMLTGYFWSGMWSRFAHTYNIYDWQDGYTGIEKDTTRLRYTLEFGPPKSIERDQLKRPPYQKELILAFKNSGRLRQ